ncbi:hypothetical protein RN001_016411 [Aquatica leii]|uniref:SAP domain-containing protein n=1 Tax=Aquatica leii TaxID=1421715 RepID=A0AAN7PP64_9COLE|nr:hypothetical protein RN001_016411 [Aquatica leii]
MEKTISNFKLEELKEKLRRRGLNTTGTKTELFNRMMANDPSGSWMYETDDDEINDDNDVRDVQKDVVTNRKYRYKLVGSHFLARFFLDDGFSLDVTMFLIYY